MTTLKEGDTAAGPKIRLVDRDGNPANLTGASVAMQVRGREGTSFAVTVDDPADGVIVVPRGDLDTGGNRKRFYDVEFEVTFSGGDIQTFPENSWHKVTVWQDLDDQ